MNTENEKAVRDPMVRAKPILWDQSDVYPDGVTEWTEGEYGFHIRHDPGEDDGYQYHAAWGEGDTENFGTLEEAQAWCQSEIDKWVANVCVIDQALSQVSNTDGWVMVPVEPTEDMCDELEGVLIDEGLDPEQVGEVAKRQCWAAMLSAAPKAPQQEQSGEASIGRAIELLERSAAPFDEACMILRQLSPATPTATASQESAPGQEAVAKVRTPICPDNDFHCTFPECSCNRG